MNKFITSAAAVILLGAATFGFSGAASAAPLNDPKGLCDSVNSAGNCVWGTGHPRSNVNIEFPSKSPQEQAIVDYATNVANNYYEVETAARNNTPSGLSELEVTATSYASGTPEAGTQTVVLKSYQFIGGAAHPNISYKAFASTNPTGTPITFDSLFRPGTKPFDVIVPIANNQISADVGQPFTMDAAVGHDPANYQNFAITNDALIFFFDKDQLAVPTGDFQVSIPRSAVATMLNPGI